MYLIYQGKSMHVYMCLYIWYMLCANIDSIQCPAFFPDRVFNARGKVFFFSFRSQSQYNPLNGHNLSNC